MNNLRFFLLFIFYVLVGCFLSILPTFLTLKTPPFSEQYKGFLTCTLSMAFVLGAVMIGFNGWNWYLCLLGDSTVEFWKYKAQQKMMNGDSKGGIQHQRFQSMLDNMFKTFGTRNIFEVFLPSIRDLPFFGHEWTLEVIELDQEQVTTEKGKI
jgi:hypothetical protein